MGNRVTAAKYETGRLLAHGREGRAHGRDDQVLLIARNLVGPFARYLDQDSLVVGHHRNQLVVHRECQAGGIKPRSDVRAARGNEYPYRFRSKGGHYSAKPNARAAAVGSTGTTTGSGADSRAHCGSFSPLPVNVTTII